MPLFHKSGIRDQGTTDTRYFTYANIACMRNLEGNDIALQGTGLTAQHVGHERIQLHQRIRRKQR
ncbi:MAG: hypothetical protein ACLR8Y_05910 [Alistipes indistinctus]